ncbi:MAG: hypothetical protein KF824_09805 [Fimbriimonadaceae bacterium]|nr:hypothetical protein [Fimbriimonadaceae bacterium]QYK52549.1 MAG: hypothetical protein KF824_09805 [Fimbriimonadaceae bacterium]
MPFEPLGTDEPLEESAPRPKSFEGQLMTGCSVILVSSFLVYLLAMWPFLVFEHRTSAQLYTALAFATIPTFIVGAVFVRLGKLAGAAGFTGGLFVGAVFLYLRLETVLTARFNPMLDQPEYPPEWKWLVPIAWLLAGLTVLFIVLPKGTNLSEG